MLTTEEDGDDAATKARGDEKRQKLSPSPSCPVPRDGAPEAGLEVLRRAFFGADLTAKPSSTAAVVQDPRLQHSAVPPAEPRPQSTPPSTLDQLTELSYLLTAFAKKESDHEKHRKQQSRTTPPSAGRYKDLRLFCHALAWLLARDQNACAVSIRVTPQAVRAYIAVGDGCRDETGRFCHEMIEWFRRLAASPRTDVETALEFDKFLFRNVGFSIHARLLRSAEVGRALLGYPIRDVLKSNDHVAWREDDTEEDFEKHWDELVEALECILADMQYNEQTLGKACFAAHCLVNSEGWKALVEVSSAFRIKALLAHLSRIFAFSKILIKALRREHMTSLLERLEPLVMISSTSSSMATIRQLTEAATYFDATPQDLDDLYHEQEQRVDGSEREGSNSRYPPFTTPTHTLGLSLHAPLLLISHILSDPNRVPKSKIVLGVSTRCCLACTHAMDILPRSHNVKVLVLTTDGDVAGGWGPPDWMDESEQMGLLEKLRLRWVYGRLRYVRNKRKEQAEDRDFWSEGDEFVIRDYMPSF